MKAYLAVVDLHGNNHTSVCKTNTPVEMLKQVFISASTGEYDLHNPNLARRIQEVEQFFTDYHLTDSNHNEIIDVLIRILDSNCTAMEEEAVYELIGNGVTDDAKEFLTNLRQLFNGEIEDLSEMTEDQSFLMAMISL